MGLYRRIDVSILLSGILGLQKVRLSIIQRKGVLVLHTNRMREMKDDQTPTGRQR